MDFAYAIEIYERLGMKKEAANTYYEKGSYYQAATVYIELYLEKLDYPPSAERHYYYEKIFECATRAEFLGNTKEATEILIQFAIKVEGKDPKLAAYVYGDKLEMKEKVIDLYKKHKMYYEAASSYEKLGDNRNAAEYYCLSAVIDKFSGSWARAAPLLEQLELLSDAAVAYENAGRIRDAARVYQNLGKKEDTARILESSDDVELKKEALKLHRELGNDKKVAELAAKIGRIEEWEYQRALDIERNTCCGGACG